MIVGYSDGDGAQVRCATCWLERARAGAHPGRVLLCESPNGPDDNFWIVDECVACGVQVRYRDDRVLE
jgi:hypothetical protein